MRIVFTSLFIGLLICAGGVFYVSSKGRAVSEAAYDSPAPPSPINRCVNMGGALEAPTEGLWGYSIREQDFQRLKSMGFDTVRIPIKWSAHTDKKAPYRIDPAFFNRIDEVTRQALDAGLQVIINVHHYDEINRNADRHTPRLMAIWEQISARYEGWPDGLMFEFLNEPHTDMTAARIDSLNRALLAEIRTKHPDRWVVLGGVQWGTLDGLTETNPPRDARTMVTFHFYDPFEFTHQGAPWAHKKIPLGQTWGSRKDRHNIAKSFARAAHWRDVQGQPLLLGEFGVYEEVPAADRANWSRYVRQTAETVGFGWCYWDWATSLGMYDQKAERMRPGMAEALLGE